MLARHWVVAWTASPQTASRRTPAPLWGFGGQTIRETVFPSVGGSMVQVRLTNLYGVTPLHIGRVAVAPEPAGPRTPVARGAVVTFGGRASVVIPAGGQATSQPVRLTLRPLQDLAVSIFVSAPTAAPTLHAIADQANYFTPGDHVLARRLGPHARRTSSWFFLEAVNVLASPRVKGAVVALGDSLTDGFRSTPGANERWPNDLARRLDALPGPELSVADAGIAGNRLVVSSRCYGASGVARSQRDLLGQDGVRAVILLEGTNDIGFSDSTGYCGRPHSRVSARQIIAGYERIIREAHQAGVRVFGGTLLPFRGASYWNPAGEAERDAVNRWIRASGAFDGVIDFAAAVADPRDPEAISPRYDSGDHLHLNDAGYAAMARAVNLTSLLRG